MARMGKSIKHEHVCGAYTHEIKTTNKYIYKYIKLYGQKPQPLTLWKVWERPERRKKVHVTIFGLSGLMWHNKTRLQIGRSHIYHLSECACIAAVVLVTDVLGPHCT